jgi:hypothetical protein
MSRPDTTIRFHLIGISLALAVIFYVVWEASLHGRTSFRLGRDTMSITVTEPVEHTLAYYYAVRRDSEVRVPKTHFRDGGGWWPPHFKVIRGADPNIVGIVEDGDPQTVLILYDGAGGASWPAETTAVGEQLLQRFIGSGSRGKGYYIKAIDEEKADK